MNLLQKIAIRNLNLLAARGVSINHPSVKPYLAQLRKLDLNVDIGLSDRAKDLYVGLSDETVPVSVIKPSDETVPVSVIKPSDETVPVSVIKPSDETVPVSVIKPSDETDYEVIKPVKAVKATRVK
jgi:hypothetical protein